MPAAGILAGKGANIGNLFCTAPKILKLHETCRGFVTADVLVKGLSRGAIATG